MNKKLTKEDLVQLNRTDLLLVAEEMLRALKQVGSSTEYNSATGRTQTLCASVALGAMGTIKRKLIQALRISA